MRRRRCIIKAYHKWLYQNPGAHAQRGSDRLEDGLQSSAIVKRSVGVEIRCGTVVSQNTLELCASAVRLCIHGPEHLQCVREKPIGQATDVDVVPDAFTTKEGKVELHSIVRAYQYLGRVLAERFHSHFITRRIGVCESHLDQVGAEPMHAVKSVHASRAWSKFIVRDPVHRYVF